jgi:hypothetical protein
LLFSSKWLMSSFRRREAINSCNERCGLLVLGCDRCLPCLMVKFGKVCMQCFPVRLRRATVAKDLAQGWTRLHADDSQQRSPLSPPTAIFVLKNLTKSLHKCAVYTHHTFREALRCSQMIADAVLIWPVSLKALQHHTHLVIGQAEILLRSHGSHHQPISK